MKIIRNFEKKSYGETLSAANVLKPVLTGVVHIVHNQHFNERIVIHKVVQVLGSYEERPDDSAFVDDFAVVCYAPFVDQINHAPGKHF